MIELSFVGKPKELMEYIEEQIPCNHEWENSRCELCGDVHEPDDFSGATEGDR